MTQIDRALVSTINESLQMDLPERISLEDLKEKLSIYINRLIQTDFEKLVSLLYRIDVNEARLKNLLHQHTENETAKVIAKLIIERQLEKINSRRENSGSDENISDEEKW